MKVIIVLRAPGNHHEVWSGEYPAAPRVGESIELPDESVHEVHSVTHLLADGTVRVLVYE